MREFAALVERHNAALERADYHAGLICAVLANINRDPKRTPRAYVPSDFIGIVAEPHAAMVPREELDDLLALGATLGAQIVVKHDD